MITQNSEVYNPTEIFFHIHYVGGIVAEKTMYKTVFKCSHHGLETASGRPVRSGSNFDDDGAHPVLYLQVIYGRMRRDLVY